MKKFPLSKVCQLIEPGPIVLVTTRGEDGVANVMTMGFHMMTQHHPPLISCVLGPWNHSQKALKKTKQCVIAIPAVDLCEQVVDIGNCSGDSIDKFHEFELTAVDASKVRAPLIAECIANLECKVVNTTLGSRYNMFVLQVVAAWTDRTLPEQRTIHHLGEGKFKVAGEVVDLHERMVKWEGLIDDDENDEESDEGDD